jgi:hypothetical protein
MEELNQPLAEETTTCENCNNVNSSNLKFCSKCSFPIKGSDEEKNKFKIKISGHKFLMAEAEKEAKTAKTIILVLAGFVFLMGLYQGLANDDFATMIVNLCISLLYLILAAWSNKNPFGAILTAFIIYITLNIVNAFFEPTSLFQGIFMKIFFIGAFIKGIRSAKDAQGHLQELEKLGAVSEND